MTQSLKVAEDSYTIFVSDFQYSFNSDKMIKIVI